MDFSGVANAALDKAQQERCGLGFPVVKHLFYDRLATASKSALAKTLIIYGKPCRHALI
jgi:hypothetical protein